MALKIIKTIAPGQHGTKKLYEEFGDKLVCVRYRFDTEKKEKIKTVELVTEHINWKPDKKRTPPNKLMAIRIAYGEAELAARVKALGGKWDRENKVWRLPLKYVKLLELENRIV